MKLPSVPRGTFIVRAVSWFFRDKDGRVVIWQWPNPPLWTWMNCTILAYVVKDGMAHAVISAVGTVALVYWAVLEVYSGVSPFRRVLGAAVIALVAVNRLWY